MVLNPSPAAERAAADALIDVAESMFAEQSKSAYAGMRVVGSDRIGPFLSTFAQVRKPLLCRMPKLHILRGTQQNPQLRNAQRNQHDAYHLNSASDA